MDANPTGADTIASAAQRINSILNPEQLPTEDKDAVASEETQAVDESESQETLSNSETESEEEKYTVVVNGEEVELTLDEMKKNSMFELDYRQKTAKTSELRRALEAKQEELDNHLKEAKDLLEIELQDLDTPESLELKEIDPEEYWKRIDTVKTKADKLRKLREKRQADIDAKEADILKREQEKLSEAIPDWIDGAVKEKEGKEIIKLLNSSGYSDDEIAGFKDHRLFVISRKAALYDRIMSKNLSNKLNKSPPKVAKPGKPSASNERVERVSKAKDKLRKTGKLRDAQRAISEILRSN